MNVTTFVSEEAGLTPEVASLLHDLRNPLSAIHSSAELLAGPELAAPQVRRLAQSIHTASRRMKELIDNFWNRYRETAPAIEPCDVRELIGIAVGKIALAAEFQSVQILQSVPENLVVSLDRPRIQ